MVVIYLDDGNSVDMNTIMIDECVVSGRNLAFELSM